MQLSDVPNLEQYNPSSDIGQVLENEVKEWHFHIYFLQRNEEQHKAALALRDSVLRLRRDGAFIAVPLHRVNTEPIGPHPAGSYEIWCPSESFASVFSYLCMNRGELSILVHPLTKEERASVFDVPLQYPSLGVGYSSTRQGPTIEERKIEGSRIDKILRDNEPEAAPAPED
ncbi:dopa -dioxygenase [Pyrrhoderma noxium]|uniref:Dopa-dioxygenase n=1 Tax=Pyrrhoderma noxium TaxID=2282107 RepID=A0A286UV15_9AGAM|nr:dopa -dioxygenase [Pyrrhoderma noxium]